MNTIRISASFRLFLLFFLALPLQGCADAKWPSWMTGEPDPAALNAKSPVKHPDVVYGDGAYWPNLADVPPKPLQREDKAERDASMKAMYDDHNDGLETLKRLQEDKP